METAIVPGIYDPALADQDLRIDTERAYRMVRRLAREEGLLAGISSGAAVAAMLDVAARIDSGIVVTVFPDGAEKYLTESFWTVDGWSQSARFQRRRHRHPSARGGDVPA